MYNIRLKIKIFYEDSEEIVYLEDVRFKINNYSNPYFVSEGIVQHIIHEYFENISVDEPNVEVESIIVTML